MNSEENLTIDKAALRFLASLSPKERDSSKQEIHKFVRWTGRDQPLAKIRPLEVGKYAEQLSSSSSGFKALRVVRTFLLYVKKQGYIGSNLASHAKLTKDKSKLIPSSKRNLVTTHSLTRQGYDELQARLTDLKARSFNLIDEIRRAAADKDFRENAPLAAAREARGLIEGQIMELEETLKFAVIRDEESQNKYVIGIGDSICLLDLETGEEFYYTLVSPKELDLKKGTISISSPIGKGVIGHSQGDTIEVETPAGKRRFQIK